MKPTYSIIIPHKNIPKLLERCLASIPLRDDLEVIIVDDDSDPAIVDFDHFPGIERADTTVIFDKSGKGAGRARNIGLEHAKGKWLLFADADDYFNYCIRDILDEYSKDGTNDIVFFSVSSVDNDLYTNSSRGNDHVNEVEKYFKDGSNEFFFRYYRGSPCSKIVRKSLIDEYNIKFQETTIHNDTRFSYISGHHAKKIKVDRRALYCITYRKQSITYSITEEKILDKIRVMGCRDKFFRENHLGKASELLWINTLWLVYDNKNKDLFDSCIKTLCSYGMSHGEIMKSILKYDAYERRCKLKRKVKNKYTEILSKLYFKKS